MEKTAGVMSAQLGSTFDRKLSCINHFCSTVPC
jgi:hypothetical protein